jgi:hypothetical protein
MQIIFARPRVPVEGARADTGVVARLPDSGELRRVAHEGETLFVRRLSEDRRHA